ncbi:MAG: sulfite exporter TauE/SafE family protein [Acidobacteriota bacterium]|nr:sulfite exporter TauE/SafE family protein [Acidobacteriota bacterium]NLH70762.1 sulfite exporter TauE/SafE family protein [Brooklawnia sp.]
MTVAGWVIGLAIVLAFSGAVVQGVIGFGMGVLAIPILSLADPGLVPVAGILGSVAMPVMALIDERRYLDWRVVAWVVLGFLPATALGVWIVKVLPTQTLQAAIAGVVLVMVALSLVRVSVPNNARTLFVSGLISGTSGTAAGIGGPPVAIVLANEPPPMVRATLATTFIFGTGISLTGLALGGVMTTNAIGVGLLMIPATILGMLVARQLRGRLNQQGFRLGVLVLSSVAAVTLLGQALL